jgi:hypothetical protein
MYVCGNARRGLIFMERAEQRTASNTLLLQMPQIQQETNQKRPLSSALEAPISIQRKVGN